MGALECVGKKRRAGLCLAVWLLLCMRILAVQAQENEAPTGSMRTPGLPPLVAQKYEVIYDARTGNYFVYNKIGDLTVGQPRVLTAQEYRDFRREESMRQFWQNSHGEQRDNTAAGSRILPVLQVGGDEFDRIFGSNVIEIVPQGSAELTFGITHSNTENYALPEDMRSNTTFDFDTKLQINLTGRIGDKLRLDVKYNTEATFDFETNVKVEYTGHEDEIIQKIEAGNVSMPLPGSLITGSQSLFGFRTDLKFGRLNVSTVLSQRKGQAQTIEVKGGAQTKTFEVRADQYEANRHFFLSKYFYDRYDQALSQLPLVGSGIEIQKIEVWVTNKQGRFDDSRDVVAFVDLAEVGSNIFANSVVHPVAGERLPSNGSNTLYNDMTQGPYAGIRSLSDVTAILAPLSAQNFQNGQDYEKLESARKLRPNEYTLNTKLGFISLNMSLNADEVLAVAYEYTYQGRTYKVGELSTDGINAPDALVVKLLKGTDLSPAMPTWRLMMKNIYSLGAFQLAKKDFQLDVLYQDDEIGTEVNYLSKGHLQREPLLSVLNLDNLNSQGDYGPDGVFDYVEGVTILPATGRFIFPMVEPFGAYLANKIGDPTVADELCYRELYDSTLSRAQQAAEKNKFLIRGEYKSSSNSEISLNAPNVPKGSVVVTAGGQRLVENTDYVVDYLLGTVKILNQGLLESGTPIKVSLESNLGLDFQTKTLVGTHLDYRFNDKFHIGGTILNLTERPLTKKVNYGNEAMSNTIWGLNSSYETEVPWLTRAVDMLPFLETKEKSSFSFDAEMAHFIPGQSSHLDKRGAVYLDDFEANKSLIDLRMWNTWSLASVPQGQTALFPEGEFVNDLRSGMQRARLAWYTIDPLFLRNSSLTPSHIRNNPDEQSSHFVREVEEQELFPNRSIPQGQPTTLPVFNLAFYPSERGPYNYDASRVNADGSLQSPTSRWGGIMRALPVTDFENSNIEYLEFWLMDPFAEDRNTTGGELYFNLGNVSEDILRDGRKFFENGLPVDDDPSKTENTAWGRVPKVQSTVMAFDNDPNNRAKQDVGLDGLNSESEAAFFSSYISSLSATVGGSSPAVEQARQDPSSDDFRYFRSSKYDEAHTGILERYKFFNNTEGNSPTTEQSSESYPTAGTTIPDAEDINRDNTLSDNESYYQYHVALRKNELEVGRNYVTDKVIAKAKFANGKESSVAWYQFKIPLKEYEERVGYIQDFKSMRFLRLYLRGFDAPVFLRFATLGLVRGEWRRYERSLLEAQEQLGGGGSEVTFFDVSAVNIEENSTRTPVNYVLPPGVTREIDASQTVENELNEQSMELKVSNLLDGDARAAFRTVSYDLRNYKRLAMDVHAEALTDEPLKDDELSLFLRLGSDYTSNYYEYEVPLKLTAPGFYSNTNEGDRRSVWPRENSIDLNLSEFRDAKLQRDAVLRNLTGQTVRDAYRVEKDGRFISVVGHPSMGQIRVLMIGIRNPKLGPALDDGHAKSGIVWVNELRLSRLDQTGGWAALASMNTRMADFGSVSLTGRLQTPGFGALENKVNERAKELTYQYDANANLEFGKFFPKRWEVSVPFYVSHGETFANPEYNPLDPDVPFDEALDHLPTQAEKEKLKEVAQDYVRRRSLNFTNVRVNKQSRDPRPWDLGNFSVTYAYNEQNAHNVKTEYRNQVAHKGMFAYAFSARPKSYEPFRRVGFLSNNNFAIIRDLNFTPMPRQITFRTEVNRNFLEQKLRNINSPALQMRPTYAKSFEWNRSYGVNWDLMRNLRLDFTANNMAVIDEPEGQTLSQLEGAARQAWKDSVWSSVRHFGRTTQYNHHIGATYNPSINKLPFLGWLSGTASYSADYRWDAARRVAQNVNLNVGNTLQNAATIQLSAQASFTTLYSKIPYLNNINQKFERIGNGTEAAGATQQEMKTVRFERERFNIPVGQKRSVSHNLNSEEVTAKYVNRDGTEVPLEVEVIGKNRVRVGSSTALSRGKLVLEAQKPVTSISPALFGEGILRVLMGLRSISASYSQTDGTFVPGYLPETSLLGFEGVRAGAAPGWPFVLGWQDPDFARRAATNGWLTLDTAQMDAYKLTRNTNFTYRINIEPFPFFRIDITGSRQFSRNRSEFYRPSSTGEFEVLNPVESGNFSISCLFIRTAFESRGRNGDKYASAAFDKFRESRLEVAQRVAANRSSSTATGPDGVFPDGFSGVSQDVLIPAFLAAYMGSNPKNIDLATFPMIPLPNWQITYDGLSRMTLFKELFRQVSLRHGYRANYIIGNYQTNEAYQEGADGLSYVRNVQQDYISRYQVTNVSISEQFSPLIGIDLGFTNSLTTKAEVRKNRSLAMSFANNQLTDMDSWEYVLGAGYRFENLPLVLKNQLGGKKVLKSELRVQGDFSVRNTQTILRKLIENTNTPTAGQWSYALKLSADYMITEQINIRFFLDRTVNTPLVSLSFPTSTTSFGFSVRFILEQ